MAETPIKDQRPGGSGDVFAVTVVDTGTGDGPAAELRFTSDTVKLGRSEDCEIVVKSPTVSRHHAEIRRTPQGYLLVDCGSANGVWIGSQRVSEHVLRNGQEFRLGSAVLRFGPAAEPERPPQPAAAVPAPTPSQAPARPPAPPASPPPVQIGPAVQSAARPSPGRPEEPKVAPTAPMAGTAPAAPKPEPPSARPAQASAPAVETPRPPVPAAAAVPTPPAAAQRPAESTRQSSEAAKPTVPPPAAASRPGEGGPAPAQKVASPAPGAPVPQPPSGTSPTPARAAAAPPAEAGEVPVPPAAGEPPQLGLVPAAPPPSLLAEFFVREGEAILASGNKPFVLDGKDSAWYVESGKVEVFTVALEGMEPAGARSHFISGLPGQLILGMDLAGFGMGSGFLAVGRMGTHLRRVSVARLQMLAGDERYAAELGALIDGWISVLSRSLTREFTPGPLIDVTVADGEETVIENQKRARSGKGVVWLDVVDGNLLFIGMQELQADLAAAAKTGAPSGVGLAALFAQAQQRRALFPVTPDTWVEASNAGGVATKVRGQSATEAMADPAFWRGLDSFHHTLCQCEFINKKLAVVDEFNRLKSKAEYAEAARDEAYRDIALVLERPVRGRALEIVREEADPTFVACKLVAEALGISARDHPEANKQADFDLRVAGVARASHFRTRQVALRDDWWNHDQGPILGRMEKSKDPVALLPTSPSSYECVNPRAGTRVALTDALAADIAPFGFAFYRPFPEGALAARDLLRFGIHGVMSDVWMLLIMGLSTGLLGSLTPFFTGKLFDAAIPQADRGLLVQFTTGLFLAALISAAFKVTQSIAVLRIQGKMDYSIQAAMWDRLLNLPSTFFRQFSAGDLADRAGGIDAIRTLVAGAGIGAILGTISSIFYVGLMFKYSLPLAMLGMALTAVFVGFTTVANYLQLRHQRDQFQIRGKITGLVLQLVSGVGKLRVAGAENHAFRVWAREFSTQRRLEFKIGRIKNGVMVFSSGFSVLSSMAVFYVLVAVTEAAAAKGTPSPLSTGSFIAFTAAYGAFVTAIQSLADASLNMLRAVPLYERLKPIITSPPETDESKTYPGRLRGELEVSHVHFRYSEDGPWILNDLTVKIEAGEFIAFVGSSGCGKSTLMRMLLGFEVPERGAVFFDGQDLANLDLREIRQQIGVVLQDSKLLPVDIFRNIVGVATDLTIDDAWDAARRAGLEDDVKILPMGMHTYVSEGGGGFSGGQQQKLLIARALVRKPRILIFDEATSALDNRSQAIVMESVEKLQATRIVIAHRLSTIINADRICYLDAGKIVEMGSYDELMKLNGRFAALARRQMA